MSENRQTPLDRGRFATAMGRLIVYSQNEPGRYAFRMSVVIAVLTVALWALTFVLLLRDWGFSTADLLFFGGGVVVMIGASALGGFVTARTTRRAVKGRPVPPDSDPARVQAAQRQIVRGVLHQDAEVNRIGGILAEQYDDASPSPRSVIVLGAVLVLIQAANTALSYDGSTLAVLYVVLAIVMAVVFLGLMPLTLRRRQRGVRRFRELYDSLSPDPS